MPKAKKTKETVKHADKNEVSDCETEENFHTVNIMEIKKKTMLPKTHHERTVINRERVYEKGRRLLMLSFSKYQMRKQFAMESLFLAFDIFDQCSNPKHSLQELNHRALVSLNLALKYEEVYPPSLDDISHYMNLTMSFRDYVSLEVKVLKELDYNLNIGSPIKFLAPPYSKKMNDEDYFQALLLLEISIIKIQIRQKYSWEEIVKAIQIVFQPLNSDIQPNHEQEILDLCKTLVVERSRVEENCPWLFRKYSNYKYQGVASKAYTVRRQ